MTIETLIVEQEGMTLDLLLWRRFGDESLGRVEAVLDENAGLAEKGVFLPVGTRVEIELPKPEAAAPVLRVLRLWG